MSEPPVVNASPLIYLAHADLFHLLQAAGPVIRVPSAVAAEIQRRGPRDPTVQAMQTAAWLHVMEPEDVSPRVSTWQLGPGETSVRVFRPNGP